MSPGSNDESDSGSDVRGGSGKDDENQAAIKTALDSLKGIRAYSTTAHNFNSARKEVNAGSRGSSSKAVAIVSAMQKKRAKNKTNKGKGKKKPENSNTTFEVKAIVLYPDITLGDPDEVNGEVPLMGIKPLTNFGTIATLVDRKLAAMNAELDAAWSFERIEAELSRLLPYFFRWTRDLDACEDGLPHWALCYHGDKWQTLMLHPDPRPTGEVVSLIKSKAGCEPSERIIYICARERVPRTVMEIWHLTPWSFSLPPLPDDELPTSLVVKPKAGQVAVDSDDEIKASGSGSKAKGKEKEKEKRKGKGKKRARDTSTEPEVMEEEAGPSKVAKLNPETFSETQTAAGSSAKQNDTSNASAATASTTIIITVKDSPL